MALTKLRNALTRKNLLINSENVSSRKVVDITAVHDVGKLRRLRIRFVLKRTCTIASIKSNLQLRYNVKD